MQTTGKVKIPEGARKKAEFFISSQYRHDFREIQNPSFIDHEFGPNFLKVHTCNESHYGKTKL